MAYSVPTCRALSIAAGRAEGPISPDLLLRTQAWQAPSPSTGFQISRKTESLMLKKPMWVVMEHYSVEFGPLSPAE